MDNSNAKIIRPKVKNEIVLKVLNGQAEEEVASSYKISVHIVNKWVTAFLRGGKRELLWTREEWERPSLLKVQLSQNYSFPTQILRNCESAAVFFASLTFGRNDAIYIYTAGVPYVLCNDIDEERLMHMKRIYPNDWEFVVGDAFTVAKQLLVDKQTFDLVTCDAPGGITQIVYNDNFFIFRKLARKYLMIQATKNQVGEMLAERGIDLENEKFDLEKLKYWDETICNLIIMKRSNYGGGSYTLLFSFI